MKKLANPLLNFFSVVAMFCGMPIALVLDYFRRPKAAGNENGMTEFCEFSRKVGLTLWAIIILTFLIWLLPNLIIYIVERLARPNQSGFLFLNIYDILSAGHKQGDGDVSASMESH